MSNQSVRMNTELNVIYVEPQITTTEKEDKRQLTRFIALFAQAGFRELALNPDKNKYDEC